MSSPSASAALRSLTAEVLLLDCQSTGASPAHGSLLELGWARASSEQPVGVDEVTSHLLTLPEGEQIPRMVTRVTGIADVDLASAIHRDEAWRLLCADMESLGEPAPTVIHYARFEKGWLRSFYDGESPFDIVCTHDIARRLLPDLPRRSLRALAGYFGYGAESLRRSSSHVAATSFVWTHLVKLLADEGVSDWAGLHGWLDSTAARSPRSRKYPMPRDKRLALPDAPGVYRMLRTSGDVLYIGKAISLKRRVNSYFQKQSKIGERMLEMLSQARDLDVTVTETALEAALLEPDEIKQHAPPYNVALRAESRDGWFASTDMRQAAREPDERYRIGPLPSQFALSGLVPFAEALHGGDVAIAQARRALGIPVAHRLEEQVAAEGFGRIRRLLDDGEPSARRLLRLGSELWRRQLRLLARGSLPPDPQRDDDEPWDVDRLTHELKQSLITAARLMRRSRWLCLLSESSVCWRTPATGTRRRVLVFERGQLAHSDYLEAGKELPLPPGHARAWRDRQMSFDVGTYDRLRVLATEIKRVVSSDPAALALRFGPERVLFGHRLWRGMRWV